MDYSVGIIGGADGPTAILVAGDPLAAVFAISALTVALILLFRHFRRK